MAKALKKEIEMEKEEEDVAASLRFNNKSDWNFFSPRSGVLTFKGPIQINRKRKKKNLAL